MSDEAKMIIAFIAAMAVLFVVMGATEIARIIMECGR